MSELFDNLPESKSPRLLWMERHDISTHHAPHVADEMGEQYVWTAWSRKEDPHSNGIPDDPEACGYGGTENEAIADYAQKNGWKLWNEESAT